VIDEAGILGDAMQFVTLVAHCFERAGVSRDSRCLITNAEKLLRFVDNDHRVFRQLKPFMGIIEGNPSGFKPFELRIESSDVVIEDGAIFLGSLDINFFNSVQGLAVALQASAKNKHGLPLYRTELGYGAGRLVHAGNNSASYDGGEHDVYGNVYFGKAKNRNNISGQTGEAGRHIALDLIDHKLQAEITHHANAKGLEDLLYKWPGNR